MHRSDINIEILTIYFRSRVAEATNRTVVVLATKMDLTHSPSTRAGNKG